MHWFGFLYTPNINSSYLSHHTCTSRKGNVWLPTTIPTHTSLFGPLRVTFDFGVRVINIVDQLEQIAPQGAASPLTAHTGEALEIYMVKAHLSILHLLKKIVENIPQKGFL